jgi:TonB family protein
MTFPRFHTSFVLWGVILLTAVILAGCANPNMAFEGNPMPEEQVVRFLQIVSPKSAYDTPPRFKRGYAPYFPEAESMKRQWGYAMTEFTIRPDGQTDDIKIVAATAMSFAQEAFNVVYDWRFTPAQKKGVAVPVRARIPFTFRTGAPSGHKITRTKPAGGT